MPDDDEETLAARVLQQEHRIYPAVIQWFAEGRLRMDAGHQLSIDGKPLTSPVRWTV
jgi:phosphoribosylglycinamide formyltransferase-1